MSKTEQELLDAIAGMDEGDDAPTPEGNDPLRTVDPEVIKKMQEQAAQSVARTDGETYTPTDEVKEMEKKYGAGKASEEEEELPEQPDEDDEDLAPLDEPEEVEKEEVEIEIRKEPVDVPFLHLEFYGNQIKITSGNMINVNNAKIQRGLQRVFRHLHEARVLERHKLNLEETQRKIDSAGSEDEQLNLKSEIAKQKAVVDELENKLQNRLL